MGGPSTSGVSASLFGIVIAPSDVAFALKSVKAAGDIGREIADCAVTMFGAPLPALARVVAEALLPDALPDVLPDWHGMQDEDSAYLQRVAAVVFDRRLALHRAAPARLGGGA